MEHHELDVASVNRFEVIDECGRAYVVYNCNIKLLLQDDNKTLKIVVNKN